MNPHPRRAPKASIRRRLLYLFLFALLVRLIIFPLAAAFGGNRPYSSQISVSGYIENLEPYYDFRAYYVSFASNFTSGLMPYQGFELAYPPLFLYLLVPFAFFSLPTWAMALPFVVFDAASVIPVFLIASKFMKTQKAVIASIVSAIAPINLFYYDFLWLNCPPMTFFTLLAAYAFLSRKYGSAFICLGIATLFKQVAIALLPVFIVTMLNESNTRGVIRSTALYGTTCFVGSLPYIVTIPVDYIWSLGVLFSITGSPAPAFSYYLGAPTSLAWVFGDNAYYPARPLLLAALLLSFTVLCWRIYKTKVVSDVRFINYILYALLLFNAFFPRGIYKYYLATIVPFGAIFVRNRRTATIFLGLNVLLLIMPRILTPWLVLLLLVLPFFPNYVRQHVCSPPFRRTASNSPNQKRC